MGGRFTEDPELMKALGADGGGFQEDPELMRALSGPRAPTPEEANGPAIPRGGKVIEMPTQNIQGDPHAGESWVDTLLRQVGKQGERMDTAKRLNAAGTPSMVGGMVHGASAHLLDPLREERLSAPPDVQRASEALGVMGSPINFVGGAPTTILGAGARGALTGGLVAGAQRYADDPNATAGDVLRSAGGGAAVGGLAGAGVQSISRGLSGMAQGAGSTADEFRLRATGVPEKEIVGMKPAALAARAAQIEDAGLVSRPFQGPRVYARNAQDLAARGGEQMGAAENAINALPEPPSVGVGDIIDAQRAEAQRLGGLADFRGNSSQLRYRNDIANRFEADAAAAGPNGELPWQRALEQRRNIDTNTSFGANPGPSTSVNAARKEVGNDLRRAIDQGLNSPSVPPQLAGDWRAGRDAYALGSQVNESALKAVGQGGQLPVTRHEAMGFVARHGGLSGVADAARNVQGGLGLAGAQANVGAGMAGNVGAQQLSDRQKALDSVLNQQKTAGAGRGNALGQAVQDTLAQDPNALGQWTQELQRAVQDGSVDQVVGRLMMNDQAFRTGPGMRLQQMTGGQ